MAIDLEKLSPAPWVVAGEVWGGETEVWNGGTEDDKVGSFERKVDAEFVALSRNVHEIMMRRGWGVQRTSDGSFCVLGSSGYPFSNPKTTGFFYGDDPFSVLVDADRWMQDWEVSHS